MKWSIWCGSPGRQCLLRRGAAGPTAMSTICRQNNGRALGLADFFEANARASTRPAQLRFPMLEREERLGFSASTQAHCLSFDLDLGLLRQIRNNHLRQLSGRFLTVHRSANEASVQRCRASKQGFVATPRGRAHDMRSRSRRAL